MSNINQQVKVLFDHINQTKNSKSEEYRILVDAIEKKVASFDEKQLAKFIKDFKDQCRLEKTKNINEGVGSAVKSLALGAILATCIANPSYAKVIVDNIQTHHPVVAKYESGKKGYDCIVKDNYGGYSYGKYQISTQRKKGNPSTFDYFMKYAKKHDPNIEYHLRKAGGWEAASVGKPEFVQKWCELTYRKDFQDLYNNFLRDNEFIPVYQRMDKNGNPLFDKITSWASQNKAVQAAVNSAIIQHGKGGAYDLMKDLIGKYHITTPEQFLDALYKERAIKFSKYKSRYKDEAKDVQAYLKSDTSKIA